MDAELVVLAAGASSRMGHPKALTPIAGEPALSRIVREAAGFRVLVVLGEHADVIRAALPALDAKWIVNPRPSMGRTGSLQRGLQACRSPRVLVLPVDHPLVSGDTMRLLAERPEPWVVPTYASRGGHPLKLGEMGVAAVLTAPPATPLRDIPAMVGLATTRVPVDDAGVLANLDTPDDVSRHA
ncbi:MAG TPA: nucleotidyltransferase family protein [Candidatus Thermoplasmatota archaeon]|nr:nucleotidyltransferase family protein [Candidatus Thermoplasmatota archaeon]